jgi:hypothetical protein
MERGIHMGKVSMTNAVVALAAIGCIYACVTTASDTAIRGEYKASDEPNPSVALDTHKTLPDVGTKMPDGTIYAGLSMDTGKPSFIAAAGNKMPDGTVYAGVSPDTNKQLYTTPEDAPGAYTWNEAIEYCKALSTASHHDWRMPTIGELAVQFNNRADIGGFNETGRMQNATGYYWSSLQVGDDAAWAQSFKDGFHENPSKDLESSLRCVR